MKSKIIKIILLLVLIVLIIPFPTESIPEWKVQTIDQNGKPIANVELIQEWKTWSQGGFSEESKITDEQGFAFFPSRKLLLPLLLRIPIYIMDSLNNFVMPHGSANGGNATISGKRTGSYLRYYENGKMNNVIVIQK